MEGVSLRLYDPEFSSDEKFRGRDVRVRFVIQPQGANIIHFEQAFSTDAGRTWEVNWIATDSRVR